MRPSNAMRLAACLAGVALLATSCGSAETGSTAVEASEAAAPATSAAATAALEDMTWEQIVETAKGSTVNWFMWGGSDPINSYVSEYVGNAVLEEYGITLNRVGINDTADAVNQVLSETEAGKVDDGSVDMIWINGENFRTLKQGNLLYCGYWDQLPNMQYLRAEDPTLVNDFGTAVDECETPWSRVQVAMIYNSDSVASPPADMDALLKYACDNPGTFTYPAPPDFTGSAFVRHVFYNEADKLFADKGGREVLYGDFDQATYDQVAQATWKTLNDLEPCLWREGSTYPVDSAALDQLFANSEVALDITYTPASVGALVENGTFPTSTRTYGLSSGTLSNVDFNAVPINSPNKAAALVVMNFLLSPEAQLNKADPSVWGEYTALDIASLPDDVKAGFAALPQHPSVIAQADLSPLAMPELQAAWVSEIEKGWVTSVAKQ